MGNQHGKGLRGRVIRLGVWTMKVAALLPGAGSWRHPCPSSDAQREDCLDSGAPERTRSEQEEKGKFWYLRFGWTENFNVTESND